MLALRISNATRILATDQDEYFALAIHDEVINDIPMMTSLWEPTPNELKQLNEGGAVRLTILGTLHPPVSITTQGPPE